MRILLFGFLSVGVVDLWRRNAARPPKGTPNRPPPRRAIESGGRQVRRPPQQPGHSLHGEAFDEGPRQKAYLMGGTGDVHFPVTTKVPLAQQFFDQGVGQLHGFWYFEAERSFRQVAALDPDCAMAYWGMAMANTNNDKRAKKLHRTRPCKRRPAPARAKPPGSTRWPRPTPAADSTDRRRKYVRDLEVAGAGRSQRPRSQGLSGPADLEERQLDDRRQEAIADLAAIRRSTRCWTRCFRRQPMHPAHHYRIHLWDDEKPARALVSASLCGQTSPGIAHMWHMPGHTYSKLHRYADAAWQQEASARVDHAPHDARPRAARPDSQLRPQQRMADSRSGLRRPGARRDRSGQEHDRAAAPSQVQHRRSTRHERRLWPRAAGRRAGAIRVLEGHRRLQQRPRISSPSTTMPTSKLKRSRLLGLAWFGLGNVEEGRKQIAALEELLKEKRAARYTAADEAEAKARKRRNRKRTSPRPWPTRWLSHSACLQNIETTCWPSCEATRRWRPTIWRRPAPSSKKSRMPSRIRKDHLARALLAGGDHAQAETLARQAVETGPGRSAIRWPCWSKCLHRAGKKPEAQAEFARLRPLAAYADLDMPVFERLKPIAAELNLPADWRGPREPAADVGQRPDLASLGPFRWQPTPADELDSARRRRQARCRSINIAASRWS